MGKREWRPYKATKREVLSFFRATGPVTIYALIERFGYSYKGAECRLYELHREGLIQHLLDRGTYGITEKGERRLDYYERQ